MSRRYAPPAFGGDPTRIFGEVARLATQRSTDTVAHVHVPPVEDGGKEVVQKPRDVLCQASLGHPSREGLGRDLD